MLLELEYKVTELPPSRASSLPQVFWR